MSVLWEHVAGDTHYSVRLAGASIRLYTNGVYHSQWNPSKPFAGAVWDCLSLPALYRPASKIKRVLLLGLGGGAVIRQLEHLADFDELVALELDPVHVTIAKQWFGVSGKGVELITADAIRWLKRYKGEPFDLIIDDLFFEVEGEPERAQRLSRSWLKLLASHVHSDGLVVINTVHRSDLEAAIPPMTAAGFNYGMRLSVSQYDNAIGVVAKEPLVKEAWFGHLRASDLTPAMRRQATSVKRRQFLSNA